MGYTVRISAYYDYVRVFFVKAKTERIAMELAYEEFKEFCPCILPETLEEAKTMDDFDFFISTLEVNQTID